MDFPNIDPVAFSIGPIAVRWYALSYIFGIGLSVLYGLVLLRRNSLWPDNRPPMTGADLIDFAFWAVIGIVGGGRIGYVLLYGGGYFLENPLTIFEVWGGGMSFHGGLIGMIVAVALFCRARHIPLLSALDLMGAIAPLAILLVRIANFINGELYGRPTELPWGIVFPDGGPLPRHPTQLYEAALEGLALFVFLRVVTHLWHGLRRPALVAGLFGIGYALARLAVETLRLPDAHIGYLYGGWLTLGMVYTLPVLLGGLVLLAIALKRPPHV